MMFIHAYGWLTARQTVLLVLTLTMINLEPQMHSLRQQVAKIYPPCFVSTGGIADGYWNSLLYSDVMMGSMASQITSLIICLLNCLFRRRSKKISKLCVTGLCVGNSTVTSEFPAQMASNAVNVSIWLRHHDCKCLIRCIGLWCPVKLYTIETQCSRVNYTCPAVTTRGLTLALQ